MEQKPDRPGSCLSQEHGCEPAESVACPYHLYDRLGRRRFCQFPSRYLRTRCKIAGCTRWKVNRVVTKVSLLDGMNLPDGPDVRCCPLADMRCSPLSMLEQTSCPAPKSGVLFVARVCNFGRLVAL